MTRARSWELLAELLLYPDPGLVSTAEQARAAVAERCPAAAEKLERFASFVAESDPRDVEELFTRTFDIQAACCLDVGYHLFGETYKRGVFLVKMREVLRGKDIPEGSELPDHLPSMLRLLARLEEAEDPRGLCEECLVPATAKMVAGFGDKPSPYAEVLRAVLAVLRADFSIAEEPTPKHRRLPVVPEFTAEMEP